ncbi:unnamed protein product [Periconia digitata]|uniref:Uncharacterized protein n=1 Tax=Periconia digitata TaxID=1303443 RepID=A0A9W4UC26_9PLEO|nr:unnamed protein product [Periconia digitata]
MHHSDIENFLMHSAFPKRFSPHSSLIPSASSALYPIPHTLSKGLASASTLSLVPNNTLLNPSPFPPLLSSLAINLYQLTTLAARLLTFVHSQSLNPFKLRPIAFCFRGLSSARIRAQAEASEK